MPSRPELVADAAVTVLGRDGLRGLTHRAVDAEASLPHGSTSNCYRSRAELLEAIVARLEEMDLALLVAGLPPDVRSVPGVAAQLASNVGRMTSPQHVRATRARLALLLDETVRPAMAEGHLRFLALLESLLAEGGHASPNATARVVSDLLEGALMHAVSVDSRSVDVEELADAVERLLR